MKGLGNDIIETQRILEAIKAYGDKFLSRIFSKEEILYCKKYKDSYIRFSGRFAAKEAVAKALGVGFGKNLKWLDLEIVNDLKGKPHVKLSSEVSKYFNHPKIHISISHCKKFATAIAIWVD
jgi:holo-[acyl-carrier protein] synthase